MLLKMKMRLRNIKVLGGYSYTVTKKLLINQLIDAVTILFLTNCEYGNGEGKKGSRIT